MGDFIVGFLDLVGSKEDLRRVDVAESEQDKRDRLEIVVRRLRAFRDDFYTYLSTAGKIESEYDAACPESLRARREAKKGNPVKLFVFSDTVVIHASLESSQRQVPLESCWMIMMAAAASQLFSLARKVPIRRGIEIGCATELSSTEIIGPVVVEALRLESEVADYPRIVVGKSLRSYVESIAHAECSSETASTNQDFAKIACALIRADIEDNAMLDILSPWLATVMGQASYEDCLQKARAFASSQFEHFRDSGNLKLAGRYAILSKYLNAERPQEAEDPSRVMAALLNLARRNRR